MDAVIYLKEKTRLCDNTYSCEECVFFKYYNCLVEPCQMIEAHHPIDAISIVERWSIDHPQHEYKWRKVYDRTRLPQN